MKPFYYSFLSAKSIFQDIYISGPYITFLVEQHEGEVGFSNTLAADTFHVYDFADYAFNPIYMNEEEHKKENPKMHPSTFWKNVLTTKTAPHTHIKCTHHGNVCEVTPEILSSLLKSLLKFQENLLLRVNVKMYFVAEKSQIARNIDPKRKYIEKETVDELVEVYRLQFCEAYSCSTDRRLFGLLQSPFMLTPGQSLVPPAECKLISNNAMTSAETSALSATTLLAATGLFFLFRCLKNWNRKPVKTAAAEQVGSELISLVPK